MANVTFSTDTDDDGSGSTGTIHNNAWKQAMATAINAALPDWAAVTFSAGNFTGNGSMTWTVASGDVGVNRYVKIGKTLIWCVQLNTTTVGGTPNTQLRIAAPGGSTFANSGDVCAAAYISDNGTIRAGRVYPASGSLIAIDFTAGGNWAAATDTTYVYFTWVGEIT